MVHGNDKFPGWLFEECYHTVGDLGRNHCIIDYLKQKQANQINEILSYYLEKFIAIEKEDEAIKKEFIIDQLDPDEPR